MSRSSRTLPDSLVPSFGLVIRPSAFVVAVVASGFLRSRRFQHLSSVGQLALTSPSFRARPTASLLFLCNSSAILSPPPSLFSTSSRSVYCSRTDDSADSSPTFTPTPSRFACRRPVASVPDCPYLRPHHPRLVRPYVAYAYVYVSLRSSSTPRRLRPRFVSVNVTRLPTQFARIYHTPLTLLLLTPSTLRHRPPRLSLRSCLHFAHSSPYSRTHFAASLAPTPPRQVSHSTCRISSSSTLTLAIFIHLNVIHLYRFVASRLRLRHRDVRTYRSTHRRPSAPSSPRRPLACSYCSDPSHLIRHCPHVSADISAGFCCRNIQGKIVLPSGLFVPRRVEGPNLRTRIMQYHSLFPSAPAPTAVSQSPPGALPSIALADDEQIPAFASNPAPLFSHLEPHDAVAESHSPRICSQSPEESIAAARSAIPEPAHIHLREDAAFADSSDLHSIIPHSRTPTPFTDSVLPFADNLRSASPIRAISTPTSSTPSPSTLASTPLDLQNPPFTSNFHLDVTPSSLQPSQSIAEPSKSSSLLDNLSFPSQINLHDFKIIPLPHGPPPRFEYA
ncbi:hypothetical protein B0H12DRAFT_1330754 [Mycena haematopus]|nr:hypothetical protein B0H12DRAFT_1330754 [Mycena haematopus]